jgi:acyl phosphate:glycerol-3-phosphate acyltransferase
MAVWLQIIGLPFLAYLLGSIPFGLILTRCWTTVDIRRIGSGNIGATNVRRAAGTPLGLATLAGDLAKGALPVWLAADLVAAGGSMSEFYLGGVLLAAFFGHLYPLYLRFKGGGKGVATLAGGLSILSPMACLVCLLTFILLVCAFGRVSVGSLGAAALLPLALWEATHSAPLTGVGGVVAFFIWLRHRDNLRRLLEGREPKAW